MIDLAIAQAVDVIIMSGDVVDRDNRYYEASGALQAGFKRLETAGIDVFIVTGNHDFDVLPQVLRNHPFPRVKLLGAEGRWEVARYERGGEILQWVGWSFPRQWVMSNPLINFPAGMLDPNYLSIGLLHADVDKLDSSYAPVPLLDLQRSAVNVWMLGHIHKPSVYSGDKIIRYPGSPQALSAKESGSHGALLLTVEGGRVARIEEVGFSNCRFEHLAIDVSTVDAEDRFRGLVENGLSEDANGRLTELGGVAYLVYDLTFLGRNNRGRQIEGWAVPLSSDYELTLSTGTGVYVRDISLAIGPVVDHLATLANERSPAGVLAEAILALRNGSSTPFLDRIAAQWEEQFLTITNSAAFQPLRLEFQRHGNPRTFRTYIEEECNRLLTELLYPSN